MPAEGGGDPVIYDHEPLRRLEVTSPGISVAVMAIFHRDLLKFIEDAHGLLEGGDAEAVRRAVHKLKGAAGSIGARELQECAVRLERICRETGLASRPHLDAVIVAGRRFLDVTAPR